MAPPPETPRPCSRLWPRPRPRISFMPNTHRPPSHPPCSPCASLPRPAPPPPIPRLKQLPPTPHSITGPHTRLIPSGSARRARPLRPPGPPSRPLYTVNAFICVAPPPCRRSACVTAGPLCVRDGGACAGAAGALRDHRRRLRRYRLGPARLRPGAPAAPPGAFRAMGPEPAASPHPSRGPTCGCGGGARAAELARPDGRPPHTPPPRNSRVLGHTSSGQWRRTRGPLRRRRPPQRAAA